MLTKKKCIFPLVFIFLIMSLAAQQSYPRPRASDVVIVTRVVIKPGFDSQFYRQYWPLFSTSQDKNRGQNEYLATIKYGNRYSEIWAFENESVFLAGKVAIPRDRTLFLSDFEYLLDGNGRIKIILPVGAAFTVPEGINYVYLGTFEYSWDDSSFDVDGIQLLDEFEDAQAFITETYGSGATLVRVPLRSPEE